MKLIDVTLKNGITIKILESEKPILAKLGKLSAEKKAEKQAEKEEKGKPVTKELKKKPMTKADNIK